MGERVPQHVQNIVLRDYCKNKKLQFIMSATEYSAKNSSYIFFELLDLLLIEGLFSKLLSLNVFNMEV